MTGSVSSSANENMGVMVPHEPHVPNIVEHCCDDVITKCHDLCFISCFINIGDLPGMQPATIVYYLVYIFVCCFDR